MVKSLEKIAQGFIAFSLTLLLMAYLAPEPIFGVITVSATVSSTMVSCTTPLDGASNSFGTIDNLAIYSATTSTTTVQSSGAIYVKIYDVGSTTQPGLWKSPDLIESPDSAFNATAALVAGTEGYGAQASTTGGTLLTATIYGYGTATNIVGGFVTTTAGRTIASSATAISSAVTNIFYKAAVSVTTPGGAYQDTVTISCSAS